MRLKQCKKCGVSFASEKEGAYLCPVCAAEAKKDSVIQPRVCIDCGASFQGFPRSVRCPDCQKSVNDARHKEYKRNGPARKLGSTDRCQICGAEYVVESGMQRYCKACSADALKANTQAHKREYNRIYYGDAANVAKKADNRRNNKVCVVCGNVFDDGRASVTCSPECARARKKYLQDKADIKRGRRKAPPGVHYDSGLPKSGVVGVTYHSKLGKWQATIKGKYLGVYDTVEAAADALGKYKEDHKDD